MHLRFSTCAGTPVVDEESSETLGTVEGIVLHPDTGKVEGFAVRVRGFLTGTIRYLPSQDIVRWGTRAWVRDPQAVSDLDDLVRLREVIERGRPVLGQSIRTESGRELGRCRDVQFDTLHFLAEWLFPRKWGTWGTAIPISQVVEVRADAVIVRDQAAPAKEQAPVSPLPAILEGLEGAAPEPA